MPEASLLYLHAITSLHPGSGTALGVVDLPVQRERHTQWPIVPGSSLKGILRSMCTRRHTETDPGVITVFGPPTADSGAHAGAAAISDARILFFPVRSLRGVFAWVTCPAVLERYQRDLGLAGHPPFGEILRPGRNQAAVVSGSPLLVNGNRLVLEEFEFEAKIPSGTTQWDWFAKNSIADEGTAARLKTHMAILHDDDFTHFVRHATEVVARVGLDYERKTVRSGALFYEEFLPPETVLYSLVFAEDSRNAGHGMTAAEVNAWLKDNIPPVMQIGANETTGKGLCSISVRSGSGR